MGLSESATGIGSLQSLGGVGANSGILGDSGSGGGLDGGKAVCAILSTGAAALGGIGTFSSSAGPGGSIAAVAFGSVAQSVQSGVTAFNTQKTVSKLKKIQKDIEALADSGLDGPKVKLAYAIDIILKKQDRKYATNVATSIPGVNVATGIGVGIYRFGRAIYKSAKGQKGVSRDQAASDVIDIAINGPGSAKDEKTPMGIANRIIFVLTECSYEQMARKALANAMKSA